MWIKYERQLNLWYEALTLELIVNENRNKYTHVSGNRIQTRQAAELQVGEYKLEEVNDFKYSETDLSNINDNHEEIKKNVLQWKMDVFVQSGVDGIEVAIQGIEKTAV